MEPRRWKRVVAFFLDLITTLWGFGYPIARYTGNLTPKGFELHGAPAVLLLALMVGYFVAGRMLGGTIWQRVFKVNSPRR